MKILIPEKFSQAGIDVLEAHGYEVDFKPEITPDELVRVIGSYEGLIVRSATTVTREVIEAGAKLKVIGRAGVGVDNIDREAATERGVIVCNAPLANIVSAAEQTMALMLAVARNTAAATASMKAGRWDRSKFTGVELQDKTLGIFGTGHVGLLVAERARAFGMKLVGYDPYCPAERAEHYGIELIDDVNEVCRRSDFITLHMPKTKETAGMIGAEQLAAMPEGAVVLNVARGGLVDMDALAAALESGHIGGAGIDVWEDEPVSDSPIHKFDNVALAPHLGASTKEAQVRAATQIAEYVMAGLEGKTVATAVNSARVPDEVMLKLGAFIPVCQKAGEFAIQLLDSAGVERVKVVAHGGISETDPTVLGTAVLAGVCAYNSDIPVNIINAPHIAQQREITVETDTDPLSEVYPSFVEITVGNRSDEVTLCAALALGHDGPRIVGVNGYACDFVPERHVIVMEYVDKPGQLGKIGATLGDAGINVESMQIAKDARPSVEVLMNVDQPVPESVQVDLAGRVGHDRAWYIDL